jgi:hypothetical protein
MTCIEYVTVHPAKACPSVEVQRELTSMWTSSIPFLQERMKLKRCEGRLRWPIDKQTFEVFAKARASEFGKDVNKGFAWRNISIAKVNMARLSADLGKWIVENKYFNELTARYELVAVWHDGATKEVNFIGFDLSKVLAAAKTFESSMMNANFDTFWCLHQNLVSLRTES